MKSRGKRYMNSCNSPRRDLDKVFKIHVIKAKMMTNLYDAVRNQNQMYCNIKLKKFSVAVKVIA